MPISRVKQALFGTDETTGTIIASGASGDGGEIEVTVNDSSAGWVHLYLVRTAAASPTSGTIEVTVHPRCTTSKGYKSPLHQFSLDYSQIPGGGLVYLGRVDPGRFIQCSIKNNTDVSLTLSLIGETFRVS